MRTYERTHPWINFEFNLSPAKYSIWLALGEAISKIDHLSKVPLQPDTSDKVHALYLAKGAAATTAIEGNTLSEEEVLAAIKGKLEVPRSKEYQKQEIENILGLFNEIQNQISNDQLPPLTPSLICSYNRRILTNLPSEENVVPGVYRKHSVLVGNAYRGAPWEDCDFLMEKLCSWLDGSDFIPPKDLPKNFDLLYAIIKAVISHVYLAWIHPFGDGNGRTARLMEFYILMGAGVPAPAAHLLSNHYNQTRTEYYRQLNYASKSGGDILPFVEYAVTGLVDGLRAQLEYIWEQNWHVAWVNYVHTVFRSNHSPAGTRRRDLALDLGTQNGPVEISAIPTMTARLAAEYALKGSKTVQRDLNVLNRMKLIVKVGRGVRARREIIQGLLPACKKKFPISFPANETSPPSSQSLSAGQQSETSPAPSHPSIHRDDLELLPQDSSPLPP